MEASSSAAASRLVSSTFSSTTWNGLFLVQRVDGVRADAEVLLDFALDGFARGEDGLEVQAGQGFQRVESLRGEEPAGGDFDRAVQRAAKEVVLPSARCAREKAREAGDPAQRRRASCSQAIFLRQPLQHVLLAFRGGFLGNQGLGVNRRQLLGGSHAVKQLLQRKIMDDGFSHNGYVSFSFASNVSQATPTKSPRPPVGP